MTQQSPERVYNGRYEIVRLIARGGMAEVFLARDQLLDRPVALKVLFPELSTDPNFVERFRREAQAAANLNHPNIVSVYDWGEEDGTYFIVMAFVDGRSLSDVIKSEGSLLPDRAADIGAAVAAALAFAHRKGVVHRDVKPGNVLIDSNEHAQVTDFGIARATSGAGDNLTQTGAVMGTATYFSPEQAQGFGVDPRSDVYSLGVVLYEMVTGQPPFSGDNPVAVAYKHVREEAVSPRQLNPGVPAAFENIVLKAMAKDADQRYSSAEELRADLLRFRQGRPVSAVAPAPATQTVAATTAVPAAGATQAVPATAMTESAPAPAERRTGAYVVLLFVMMGLLALLLFLLAREFSSGSTTAQVTVPSVETKTVEEALRELDAQGLDGQVVEQDNEADAGTVFSQDPPGGQKVRKGAAVKLFVSKGAPGVAVPEVVGLDQAAAERALRNAEFEVQVVPQVDESTKVGRVVSQEPGAGETAAKGSTIKIFVSSGKEKVTVPDVRGRTASQAGSQLTSAGLQVGEEKDEASATVPAGRVIRTDPAGGQQVDKGSTVTLVVSSGPTSTDVPNVIGKKEEAARSQLEAAGFKVTVQQQLVTDPADDGRVIDQNPNGGTQAPQGSTVTITVGHRPTSTSTSVTTSTTAP